MRTLITGGGGFIGTHLTHSLLDDGHDVIIVDNFCSSRRTNIAEIEDDENVTLVEQDVLEPLDINRELDYVLHLASRASPPDYQDHPVHTLRTNSEGTMNMLELAAEHGAKFLYSSTSEVYGDPEVHPQPEEYNGNVNPVGPRACYDEGKRFGEAAITSFAGDHAVDWRIVRIFNTYGPRMRPDDGRAVSTFVRQALQGKPLTVYGDGTQTRSFCFIDDMVAGIRASMSADSETIVNLGNPEEHTIQQLAEMVIDITGADADIIYEPLPEDDPERRKPDITRALNELGWTPSTPLREGLERTAQWFEDEI